MPSAALSAAGRCSPVRPPKPPPAPQWLSRTGGFAGFFRFRAAPVPEELRIQPSGAVALGHALRPEDRIRASRGEMSFRECDDMRPRCAKRSRRERVRPALRRYTRPAAQRSMRGKAFPTITRCRLQTK
jgi:hypothetical protein